MEPEEARLVEELVSSYRPIGPLLEIGTAAGGTLCGLLTWAHGQPVVVVDPMNYFPHQRQTVFRNLAEHGLRQASVELRSTTSHQAFCAAEKGGERFGFILIDAKHDVVNVMLDLRWARLLRPGGLLLVHDFSPRFPGVQWATSRFLKRNSEAFRAISLVGTLLAIEKLSEPVSASEFSAIDRAEARARLVGQSAKARIFGLARRYLSGFQRWAHVECLGVYQDRYLRHEYRRLSSGRRHQTLGLCPENDGKREFRALLSLGLRPSHTVVDFGCGSLRLGRLLIDHLKSGQYWGLDITEHFIRFGLERWYSARTLPKRAHFAIISPTSLDRAALAEPNLVLVLGVLHCVPPKYISNLLRQLRRLCSETTIVLATLLEGRESIRVGEFSFRHSLGAITASATAAGLSVRVLIQGQEADALGAEGRRRGGSPDHKRNTLLLLRVLASSVEGESLAQP